jgi:hypothetical protein
MKKTFAAIAFVLALCSANKTRAQEQEPIYVGIKSDTFRYFSSQQHSSNWCWAASLQMIFNYYGIAITQEQIVARSCGVVTKGALPNRTGNWRVITANLNNWSVDNAGKQYIVRAVFNSGPPDPVYLIGQLSLKRPVLIGYRTGPNSAHAVVITACSYIQTDDGPVIQSFIVRAIPGPAIWPMTAAKNGVAAVWPI